MHLLFLCVPGGGRDGLRSEYSMPRAARMGATGGSGTGYCESGLFASILLRSTEDAGRMNDSGAGPHPLRRLPAEDRE